MSYVPASILPSMHAWYRRYVTGPAAAVDAWIEARANEIVMEWPGLSWQEAIGDAREEARRQWPQHVEPKED